jgi:phosphoribosylformylglycinamidine synthase
MPQPMKIRVHVALKNGVHDPQGEAVQRALGKLGLAAIEEVHIGKFIDLEVAGDEMQALATAKKAAEQLLANTVIERFWVEKAQ